MRSLLRSALLWIALGMMPMPAEAALDQIEQTTQQLSQTMKSYQDQLKERGEYDSAFRRDPMQALVDSQGQLIGSVGSREGSWIQGIIWSDTQPVVVVDGQLFGPGEVVGPYEILEIHPDRVIVQKGDQQETISLDRETEEKRD